MFCNHYFKTKQTDSKTTFKPIDDLLYFHVKFYGMVFLKNWTKFGTMHRTRRKYLKNWNRIEVAKWMPAKKIRKRLFLLNQKKLLAVKIWKRLKIESYTEKAVFKKFWKHFGILLCWRWYTKYISQLIHMKSVRANMKYQLFWHYEGCLTFENIYAVRCETSINLPN